MAENSDYQESMFAPFVEKIESAIAVMKNLAKIERHFVLVRLFSEKEVSFAEVSKMYVEILEKEKTADGADIATLSLWLGLFLRDRSPDTLHMRRHLWEKGYHRGSAYGDRLDQEFCPKI